MMEATVFIRNNYRISINHFLRLGAGSLKIHAVPPDQELPATQASGELIKKTAEVIVAPKKLE